MTQCTSSNIFGQKKLLYKKCFTTVLQRWFKIKWDVVWCKVKSGGVIYGLEGFLVFTFYMV